MRHLRLLLPFFVVISVVRADDHADALGFDKLIKQRSPVSYVTPVKYQVDITSTAGAAFTQTMHFEFAIQNKFNGVPPDRKIDSLAFIVTPTTLSSLKTIDSKEIKKEFPVVELLVKTENDVAKIEPNYADGKANSEDATNLELMTEFSVGIINLKLTSAIYPDIKVQSFSRMLRLGEGRIGITHQSLQEMDVIYTSSPLPATGPLKPDLAQLPALRADASHSFVGKIDFDSGDGLVEHASLERTIKMLTQTQIMRITLRRIRP